MAFTGLLCCLALLVSVTAGAKIDPPKKSNAVKKVIEMLQDLDAKIVKEGESEEKTYTKFEWWCTDTKEEKEEAIKDGEDLQALLEANIEQFTTEKHIKQSDIDQYKKDIIDLKTKIQQAADNRTAENADYKTTNADTEHAIKAADQALKAIERSVDGLGLTLTQMGEEVKALRHAALMADSMGLESSEDAMKAVDALESNVPIDRNTGEDWKKPVLDMLEELQDQFRTANQDQDMEEANASAAYKLLDQDLNHDLERKQKGLDDAEMEKQDRISKIAQAEQDLEMCKTTLADDRKFLADVTQNCAEKKATYDQRVATRDEELAALREATHIMEDTMSAKRPTQAQDDDALLLLATAAEPVTAERKKALAFLQQSSQNSLRGSSSQGSGQGLASWAMSSDTRTVDSQGHLVPRKMPKQQEALVQFLERKAKETKSSKIAMLAIRAGADPFKQIKDLITGLIADLQQKASDSQSKKMACDKKISESETKRDRAHSKVQKLNTALKQSEARKDKLADEIDMLSKELTALETKNASVRALRNEESSENDLDIEEAKAALSGCEQALDVINTFYGQAKENEVDKVNATEDGASLLRVDPEPDAGFKNYEANKGSQAASTGIVGMMETIISDFERTIADTKDEEKDAVEAHKAVVAEIEKLHAKKQKTKDLKTGFEKETLDKIAEDESALAQQMQTLETAVLELKAHDEECGQGANYERRKKNREEEMEVLKEAISFFDDFLKSQ
eukprot:TRINITY_DN6172_c0_g1_i2.p1 TRINITY_DN6172_c0_g1~~TRINITY_DN6172_c0_g1_i2.p1  ORF type:complete len:740 (+),score=260.77 TRINITY_DN6172_c0_g1_i2:83-2302(+)